MVGRYLRFLLFAMAVCFSAKVIWAPPAGRGQTGQHVSAEPLRYQGHTLNMRTSDDLWDSLAWMEAVERKEVLFEALDSLLVTQFTEAKVEVKNRLGEKVCALADRGDDFLRQVACSALDLLVGVAFWGNQKVLLGNFLDWAKDVEGANVLREQANVVKQICAWLKSVRCQPQHRYASRCLEKEFLATFDRFTRFSVTDVELYEQMCTASVTDGADARSAAKRWHHFYLTDHMMQASQERRSRVAQSVQAAQPMWRSMQVLFVDACVLERVLGRPANFAAGEQPNDVRPADTHQASPPLVEAVDHFLSRETFPHLSWMQAVAKISAHLQPILEQRTEEESQRFREAWRKAQQVTESIPRFKERLPRIVGYLSKLREEKIKAYLTEALEASTRAAYGRAGVISCGGGLAERFSGEALRFLDSRLDIFFNVQDDLTTQLKAHFFDEKFPKTFASLMRDRGATAGRTVESKRVDLLECVFEASIKKLSINQKGATQNIRCDDYMTACPAFKKIVDGYLSLFDEEKFGSYGEEESTGNVQGYRTYAGRPWQGEDYGQLAKKLGMALPANARDYRARRVEVQKKWSALQRTLQQKTAQPSKTKIWNEWPADNCLTGARMQSFHSSLVEALTKTQTGGSGAVLQLVKEKKTSPQEALQALFLQSMLRNRPMASLRFYDAWEEVITALRPTPIERGVSALSLNPEACKRPGTSTDGALGSQRQRGDTDLNIRFLKPGGIPSKGDVCAFGKRLMENRGAGCRWARQVIDLSAEKGLSSQEVVEMFFLKEHLMRYFKHAQYDAVTFDCQANGKVGGTHLDQVQLWHNLENTTEQQALQQKWDDAKRQNSQLMTQTGYLARPLKDLLGRD